MELTIESLKNLGWFGYVLGTVLLLDRFGFIRRKNGGGTGMEELAKAVADLSSNVALQNSLLERMVSRQDEAHDLLVELRARSGI